MFNNPYVMDSGNWDEAGTMRPPGGRRLRVQDDTEKPAACAREVVARTTDATKI